MRRTGGRSNDGRHVDTHMTRHTPTSSFIGHSRQRLLCRRTVKGMRECDRPAYHPAMLWLSNRERHRLLPVRLAVVFALLSLPHPATAAKGEKKESSASEAAQEKTNSSSDVEDGGSCPCAGSAGTLWFLDGGFRLDRGNFRRADVVGRNEQIDDDDVDAWGGVVHVGFLTPLNQSWRMGGAVGYGGNYDLDNNGQLLGQLFTADWRVEVSAPLTGSWSLIGMPRVGASLIVPGGVLQDRITANQQAGYGTWSGPRFGFLVGAAGGARYRLNDWFSMRATVGYTFTMHFLLNSRASSEFVSASQTWRVHTSRLTGLLGLEATF